MYSLVSLRGLEPLTFSMSMRRSSQLSYRLVDGIIAKIGKIKIFSWSLVNYIFELEVELDLFQ